MTPVAPEQNLSAPEEPKSEDASQPRKTGWWSRRLAGGGNG
jgi:hypothetical protein